MKIPMTEFLEKYFSAFYPISANYDLYPELTFIAANSFPDQLFSLLKLCKNNINSELVSINDFSEGSDDARLASLFNKYGSDKEVVHGYSRIYGKILNSINRDEIHIFEIGIGTNNPNAISTMGAGGKPGASLRAFRDYAPGFYVYGADIDRSILFSEERIQTSFIDQTKYETYSEAAKNFNKNCFDIIIDDGLHSPLANINTLIYGLNAVNNGGYIIIEDISAHSRAIWDIIKNVLPSEKFDTYLISRDIKIGGYMFVVYKK